MPFVALPALVVRSQLLGSFARPFPDAGLRPFVPVGVLPDPASPAATSLRLIAPALRWLPPPAACWPPTPPSPALPANNWPSRLTPGDDRPETASIGTADTNPAPAQSSLLQSGFGNFAHVPGSLGPTCSRKPDRPAAHDRPFSARPPPIQPAPPPGSFAGSPPPNVPSFGHWLRYSGASRPVSVAASQPLPSV